jgi:hypothetical protein
MQTVAAAGVMFLLAISIRLSVCCLNLLFKEEHLVMYLMLWFYFWTYGIEGSTKWTTGMLITQLKGFWWWHMQGQTKGPASQATACRTNLWGVLWYCRNNRKYDVDKLKFPYMKEFLWILYAICAHTFRNFASPVIDLKISKNVGFKGCRIIYLAGVPTCTGPALDLGSYLWLKFGHCLSSQTKRDKQCTYNLTLWHVCITIVAVETQQCIVYVCWAIYITVNNVT